MTDINEFVSNIGVNTHVDATTTGYGNIALVEASLAYTGISLIRDHAYDIDLAAYTSLTSGGVGLDLILDDDPKVEIDSLISLAPSIRYLEGPNEVDYQPILTNDIVDPVLAAVTEQASVRSATSALAIPLIAESVADPANLAAFAGNLAYADFANLHAYAVQGHSPRGVLTSDLALANALSSKPVAVTETGYFTLPSDPDGNGVDETVQAKLTLDILFDSAALGLAPTFLYELLDEAPDPAGTDTELHYGLFRADGSPKLAATALHNLTTILAAANTTPGTAPALSLTTSNLPDTGQTLVLTGAAGTTIVAIWAEPQIWDSTAHAEIAAPITMTTLDFGTLAATATVFDPLLGTAPIATYTNVSSVTVGLTDHPLLLELLAPLPTTGATPGTATDTTIGVYRFFDITTGTHFYTASASEAATVRQIRLDLVPEGSGGIGLTAIDPASNDPNAAPIYRFFDTTSGTHFFTASLTERAAILTTRPDLTSESIGFYEHASPQSGDIPVYRFFDIINGTHFYTDSPTERAALLTTRSDLTPEGIGFYEPPSNPA